MHVSITRREADIAIRHVRPEQPSLIARRIGEIQARFYASSGYLDEHGRPRGPRDLSEADFVGPEQPERFIPEWNMLGLSLTPDNFRTTTSSGTVVVELVRRGFGVAPMPSPIAMASPELECALPELAPVPMPLWLATHRELHTSRRIRLVFDFLGEALAGHLNSSAGRD